MTSHDRTEADAPEITTTTLKSVAEALGVSKTTVSRALSGNGRVGDGTRQRILDHLSENHLRLNTLSADAVPARPDTIAVVLPSAPDSSLYGSLLDCLFGICDAAAIEGFDVLTLALSDTSADTLRRRLSPDCMDGIIFIGDLDDADSVQLLRELELPFTVIGSSLSGVAQTSLDIHSACRELTRILLSSNDRVALLGDDRGGTISKARQSGFQQAFSDLQRTDAWDCSFLGLHSRESLSLALGRLLALDVDCIIAENELLCAALLELLRERSYRVPDDIRIACFSESPLLAANDPPITCISFNHRSLGINAANMLFGLLGRTELRAEPLVRHEILLRRSTASL